MRRERNEKDEPRNTSSATESDDPKRDAPHTDREGLKDARTVIDAPSKGQRKSWHTDDRSRSGELLEREGLKSEKIHHGQRGSKL